MAETKSFHEKTKAVKPKLAIKPTTYWTGVLFSDKKPEGPKTEDDYLWIKCPHKVNIATIKAQYQEKTGIQENFVLKHELTIPTEETMMRDLDVYCDKVIAFEAVLFSDLRDRMAAVRKPLQSSGNQNTQQKVNSVDEATFKSPYKSDIIIPKGRSDSNTNRMFPNLKPVNRNTIYPHDENLPPNTKPNLPLAQPSLPTNTNDHASYAPEVPKTGVGQDHNRLGAFSSEQHGQATNAPFIRYFQAHRDAFKASRSYLTEVQLHDIVWEYWANLSSAQRAPYYAKTDQAAATPSEVPNYGISSAHTGLDSDNEDKVKAELDFKDHFSNQGEHASTEKAPRSFQLQSFVEDASLEVLEASVETGVKFLESLKGPLLNKVDVSPDAARWVQQVERLQGQATKTKTVIGVVGNTGAGKSSVINAMLDEERLVPTNTMRACTAVVTELSYNYSSHAYRAEIEFISVADWEKELKTLFQDLLDGNSEVSRDCTNEDSDAGIAYAKIKAVYPKKTKEDISNSSIEKMLQDVSHVLGKTRNIEEDDSLKFYKNLQHYVDSKEKVTTKDKDKKAGPKEMEFWPLIKVVRIFVKSPALSTGAVIVDLPGVHDANAARAAVAEGYMKQCTGLWIVAPIIRAVDDKAAKNLLGESFKRQLKMDGGFDAVTFICSKTDDISLMEASDSLGLDEVNTPAWEKIDGHVKRQKSLKKELEDLKDTKAAYEEVITDVDDQLETWEELREKMDGDEGDNIVYAPELGKKRKKSGGSQQRKKRKRSSDDKEDEDYDEEKSSDEEDNEDDELVIDRGEALTEEQIAARITELRTEKKEARKERIEIEARMRVIRADIAKAQEEERRIEAGISRVCIEGRNAYSKGAIQQDFASGIKELDQEIAAEEDEENFNPEDETRDYEEVARSLPVFCVSSRGYQKLQGRLKKDNTVPGFESLKETEIPQLQAHCKQLTVAGRTSACKRFMTNLNQLLNSISLWASSDGSGANLTADQRAKEARFLQKSLESLESGLKKLVIAAVNDLKEELADNIYDRYDSAIAKGTEQAGETSARWGARINREDRAAGGYFWSTYKAICRRNGVYSNGQGPHDWNTQMADPMLKVLSGGWERTFSRRTPTVMSGLARNASNLLKAFHRDIDLHARQIGVGVAGLHMLEEQLKVYDDIFKDLTTTTRDSINAQQKDINREFIPVIERAMGDGYDACVAERGTGSYARMKTAMTNHVDQQRLTMFTKSTEEVRTRLKEMLRGIEETLNNKADEVFLAMSRDYYSVLGGGDVPQGEIVPKWQRATLREVKEIIDRAEKIFKRVAGIEIDEDDTAAFPDQNLKSEYDENGLALLARSNEARSTGQKSEQTDSSLNVKMELKDGASENDEATDTDLATAATRPYPDEEATTPLEKEATTPLEKEARPANNADSLMGSTIIDENPTSDSESKHSASTQEKASEADSSDELMGGYDSNATDGDVETQYTAWLLRGGPSRMESESSDGSW